MKNEFQIEVFGFEFDKSEKISDLTKVILFHLQNKGVVSFFQNPSDEDQLVSIEEIKHLSREYGYFDFLETDDEGYCYIIHVDKFHIDI